ncbi:LysE family transporter, partial [Pseudomonas aeruginosa]|uniref:LysE/ArgO family amino acid transporter n=1 Tax=Pseudomonas aeruginosa TaxID=287 RepID=UPI00287DCDAD
MWQSYLNGILVAAGLIIAIGAQNAFVLAQSLRREHHLSVAALCGFCDAVLVSPGVVGLSNVRLENPTLLSVALWGG